MTDIHEESRVFVTPSEVMEYLYCPRFIYYMNVLNVQQHEHNRALVNKGRDIHKLKMVQNKAYLRKTLNVIDKKSEVYMKSETLKLVGKVDEVLFFADGFAAPLDYKYAYWDKRVYKPLLYQQALYASLIEETFSCEVQAGYLVYIRSKNHVEKVDISARLKTRAKEIVDEIFAILNINYFPQATKTKSKCLDCTYRNLCGI